ncbi:MAG: cupin domain-containing protein [Ruminococcaceae bacterium]|nr:cupin domain-containing protein [Oscillospiraceae bacterium]
MIKRAVEMKPLIDLCAEGGRGELALTKMSDYFNGPDKLEMFAYAELEPGAEVGYHVHIGEMESYYIITGEGTYNDNGVSVPIKSGDMTYTPNGEGHGIKNTGTAPLGFIALIVKD